MLLCGLNFLSDYLTDIIPILKTFQTKEENIYPMIGSKVTAMQSGGFQIGRFCLVMELHRGGSVTNGAIPSSLCGFLIFECSFQGLIEFFCSFIVIFFNVD